MMEILMMIMLVLTLTIVASLMNITARHLDKTEKTLKSYLEKDTIQNASLML